jgi:hypothetical protein
MSFFKKIKRAFEIKKMLALQDRGAAIFIILLLAVSISLIVILGFATPLVREFQNARNNLHTTQAYYAAESGNEDAYYRIKNGMQVGSFEQIAVGSAISSVSITGSADSKTITASSSVFSRVRKIETKINKSIYTVDLKQQAVFSGVGGITMGAGAEVQGNVYASGKIEGAGKGPGGSIITGDVVSSSNLVEDTNVQATVCSNPASGGDMLVGKTSPKIDYAQSFIPTETKQISSVSFYIKENSTPLSTIHITEDDMANNRPLTTALVSQTIPSGYASSSVGVSYSWVTVVFSNGPTLNAGQKYWIVFETTNSNGSKYFTWCRNVNDVYASGTAMYSDDWKDIGETWTTFAGDLTFKTYFGYGLGVIKDVKIEGTAKANAIDDVRVDENAYYQTIVNPDVGGVLYPGSTDPTPIEMPISDEDIALWKQDAAQGGVLGSQVVATTTSLGPKKIVGNLTVDNSAVLTITGTIYVTGDILLDNNSKVKCDYFYGSNGCMIISDGLFTLQNGASGEGSDPVAYPKSNIMFISTREGGNSVTAMDIKNNASGVIFYAPHAAILISNNAIVEAVVGYLLVLDNNTRVIYTSDLDDIRFTPRNIVYGDTWVVNSWSEIE